MLNKFILLITILLIIYFLIILILKIKTINKLTRINLELQLICKEQIDLIKKKNLLIKEIHHRVKNNLQLIISLLSHNFDQNDNLDLKEVINKIESRIFAMAIIHYKLCGEEEILKINFQDYLEELISNIKDCYDNNNNISIEINSKDIFFDIDTSIPIGLIINELVINSLKYAFNPNIIGKISIVIKKQNENQFLLLIGDNGKGIKNVPLLEGKVSIGLNLVELLVKQLKGEMKKINQKGTNYIIIFSEKKIKF